MKVTLAVTACCFALTGCAAVTNSSGTTCKPNAVPYAFTVAPAAGQPLEPDHTAAPPANQKQFQGIVAPDPGPGCPVPEWLLLASNATWTVSDTVNVEISSTAGSGNGLATCVGATNGPATVTATVVYGGFTLSNTSTITCK